MEPDRIVAVDIDASAVAGAANQGFVAIQGNATNSAVLDQAAVRQAKAVIIAPNRDDTAVLATLTVREINTTAHIVAGGRDQENLHLLRQGGADEVIDATAAVGRMLGIATKSPGRSACSTNSSKRAADSNSWRSSARHRTIFR